MAMRNTASSYGSIAKFFHWVIFLLVAGVLTVGFFMGDIADKVFRGEVVNMHKLFGVLVLVLMLLRVLWALINVKPELPFQTPAWQRVAERLMHFLLYAGLIIMPMSGLVGSVAAGKPPHLGSLIIELPISQNKAWAEFSFENIHEPLAFILLALISIHILAALYHHFVKRDDILRRMLPWRSQR